MSFVFPQRDRRVELACPLTSSGVGWLCFQTCISDSVYSHESLFSLASDPLG